MLTREEDIDAHALRRQGWTISAIARHLGRDRKTIRAYLAGDRVAGERKPAEDDRFDPFVDYVRERLREDPHLWAVTLFDEVTGLGYDRSYPTFTRQIRTRGLRPHCEPCSATKGRPAAVIEHPAGEETQWDWVELPDPPASWGWGKNAHLLVGALAHSGRWRGTLAAAEDQAQLIDALDKTTRKLGGLTKKWRFDRMTTVCRPESGKVTATFAEPTHPADLVADSVSNSFWAAPTTKGEATLVFTFDRAVNIDKAIIQNGDNDKFDQSFRVERLHLVYSNGKTEDLQLKDQPDPQELTLQNGHNITSVEMHVMATYQSLHGTDVAISEIELFQRS